MIFCFTAKALFIHIPFYKKIASYFWPVVLRREDRSSGDYLELTLFQRQFQLSTNEALYSDGDRYTPAIMAVKQLRESLPGIKSVLILGSGLGSMVQVMRKWKADPHFTLVEIDKLVLEWAMELLQPLGPDKLLPVCDDAAHFLSSGTQKYDLVFLDIFNGRYVPSFVCTEEFILLCRQRLMPGGHIAFNYIVNDENEWNKVLHIFRSIFPQNKIIAKSVNRVLIGAN